jgi:DNA-binding XRE family transcriptional regulator
MPDRPPELQGEELTKLRLKNGMSQAVFAQVLNVSTKTVQSWEQGQCKPSHAALSLIQVFRQNQSGLLEILEMSSWNHGSHRITRLGKESRFVFVGEGSRAMMSAAISNSEGS